MVCTELYYGITFPQSEIEFIFKDIWDKYLENYDDKDEALYEFVIESHTNLEGLSKIKVIKTDFEFRINEYPQDFTIIIGIFLNILNVRYDGAIRIPEISNEMKNYFDNFLDKNPMFEHFIPSVCVYTNAEK